MTAEKSKKPRATGKALLEKLEAEAKHADAQVDHWARKAAEKRERIERIKREAAEIAGVAL